LAYQPNKNDLALIKKAKKLAQSMKLDSSVTNAFHGMCFAIIFKPETIIFRIVLIYYRGEAGFSFFAKVVAL
jgi:hypothetical protein